MIQSIQTLALCLCLLASACASQLRPPTAPLGLEIRSVDFATGSAKQIFFEAKGFIRNPNELAIKLAGFTYQTFIEGNLVDSGSVEVAPFVQFKSRQNFVVPLRIPTSRIDGYVAATRLNGIHYRINLQLTDERFKRITLDQQGVINLSHILRLPGIEAQVTNFDGQLLAETTITNPNDFILVIDNCFVHFTEQGIKSELFSTSAFAPLGERTFSIPLPFDAKSGQLLTADLSCQIDDTAIGNSMNLVVK